MNNFEEIVKSTDDSIYNNRKCRKAVIWGASVAGKFLKEYLGKTGIEVEFFLDRRAETDNFYYEELKVLPPSVLKGKKDEYYVLVAMDHYDSVEQKLEEYGYNEMIDYIYYIHREYIVEPGISKDIYGNVFDVDNPVKCGTCCWGSNITVRNSNGMEIQAIGAKITLENVKGNLDIYAFESEVEVRDAVFELGGIIADHNSKVTIMGGCYKEECGIGAEDDSSIIVEGGADVQRWCGIMAKYGSRIKIGKEFLTARLVRILAGDGHPIYDYATHEQINRGETVTIGNHVWVGEKSTLLGGTSIGDDCVVGANSLVNKSFEGDHRIIAGNPARLVREGITWKKEPEDEFYEGC